MPLLVINFRPVDHSTSIASIHVTDLNPNEAFLPITMKVVPVLVLPTTSKAVPGSPPPLPREGGG